MSVDEETVRRVAHLARIAVADDEIAPLAHDLNRILGWVEQLGEVDVDGVEPMAAVNDLALKQREDQVADGGDAAKILSDAPEAAEGFFAVPKVVE